MKKFGGMLLSICLLLLCPMQPAALANEKAINFTVVFKSQELPWNAPDLISKLGGKITCSIPEIGVAQVQAPPAFAGKAAKDALILAASPSLVVKVPALETRRLNSTAVSQESAFLYNLYQWDIKRVTNGGASFKLGTGNHGVAVGIIDSGIDLHHPDLQANLLAGSKNFVPAGGFSGNDLTEQGNVNDVMDRYRHGTHVAGSIAGHGAILGVAPDVGIRAYRVMGATGETSGAAIAMAAVAAANDRVDVINLSLSGIFLKGQAWYTDPASGEKVRLGNDLADYAAILRGLNYAHSRGSLVVAAAGNDSVDAGRGSRITDFLNALYGPYGFSYTGTGTVVPADLPNVVAVSSTGPDDQLALYSNFGSGFINVAAPGGDCRLYFSTPPDQIGVDNVFGKEFCLGPVPVVQVIYSEDGAVVTGYNYLGPGYDFNIGTSMAAPKASAVAALIISKYGRMQPGKLKAALQNSAQDIGSAGYDSSSGHGLVNAYTALGGK